MPRTWTSGLTTPASAANTTLVIRLEERETAHTVRVRDGKLLVTDGPFAETKETLAGFALLECETFEDAVELARRNPASHFGRIELRPVNSFGGPILARNSRSR